MWFAILDNTVYVYVTYVALHNVYVTMLHYTMSMLLCCTTQLAMLHMSYTLTIHPVISHPYMSSIMSYSLLPTHNYVPLFFYNYQGQQYVVFSTLLIYSATYGEGYSDSSFPCTSVRNYAPDANKRHFLHFS